MDNPIFFDKSGLRWRVVKTLTLTFVILIVAFISWLTPQSLTPRPIEAFGNSSKQVENQDNNSSSPLPVEPTNQLISAASILSNKSVQKVKPSASKIVNQVSNINTAVIGVGPLVRLIEVSPKSDGYYAVDPFNSKTIRSLSPQEVTYIDNDKYAIERYGDTSGKRLMLTFDDGPSLTYTTRLLDLLSRESVRATFFVVGSNVVQYPEIAQRIVSEGHAIGNHTFSHVDFDFIGSFRSVQEINQTQRITVAATGHNTAFFRPPYGGGSDQSFRNSIAAIAQAQQLGYVITSYDFDSNDWKFNDGFKPVYPILDGTDQVILMHDGGGDRTITLRYVENLIKQGKAQGYTFANLSDIYPEMPQLSTAVKPTIADYASMTSARAVMIWPKYLIHFLFGISLVSIMLTTILNTILAIIQHKRTKPKRRPVNYCPDVSIIVPAYNEGKVIISTIESLLRSYYRKIEIIIVDDGSTDDTWEIAQSLADKHKRVTAIKQPNGGKSSALNNAIARSTAEIIICVDADTIFPPQTITKLIRHFKDEKIAAVAGVVKVGNVNSMITRWQAFEYTTSISIERNAQSFLNSIMIIPGACGAWRRSVVVEIGGFSHSTLAEDCDLTIKIQKLNKYKIIQDNEAISYTEAPQALKSLMKQRFRWIFGNIQALWQHRSMIGNREYGWLGMFVMTNSVVSVMIPLLFWPLLTFVTLQNIINGNYIIVLIYFSVSLFLQFAIAAIGIKLAKEKFSYLVAVPYARFIYGPIRTYILYKTVITALRGSYVGWNKLVRTGTATFAQPGGKRLNSA